MVAVALLFDGLQAAANLLHGIPLVGNLSAIAITGLISVWAWLTFYVWFKLNGISFVSPKRALALNGGFLLEIIPVLNALPAWTAAVVIIFLSTRAEELLEKVPGGSKIAGAALKAGGAPGGAVTSAPKPTAPPRTAPPAQNGRVPPRLSEVRSPA